jgi:hypothetical protein
MNRHLAFAALVGATLAGLGVAPATATAATAPPAPLTGYRIVQSIQGDATANSQTIGDVTCPGTRVPLGGGLRVSSTSTAVAIKASFPTAHGWSYNVVNASSTDTAFTAFAVCAFRPPGYAVVQDNSTVAAGHDGDLAVACPGRKVPTGGGVAVGFADTGATMKSSALFGQFWFGVVNNPAAVDIGATVLAVCVAPLKGYHAQTSAAVANPAGSQTLGSLSCGAGKVATGGGVASTSPFLEASINSSYPVGRAWDVYENNGSPVDATFTTVIVCAVAT